MSSTVRELLVGSGVEFESIGEQDLEGIPGRWTLFKPPARPSTDLQRRSSERRLRALRFDPEASLCAE